MKMTETLVEIALDMAAALSTRERCQRLLGALKKGIPYDAAALFRLEGETLVPVATTGLNADAMGRRFRRQDHPRLDIICSGTRPVRFSGNSPLPDPFDGLIADNPHGSVRTHSCLGSPLHADGVLIGALTADAVDPDLFQSLDLRFVQAIAALAGAQMRAMDIIDALDRKADGIGLNPSTAISSISPSDGHPAHFQAKETLSSAVAAFKRKMILSAVRRNNGNWAAAGRDLGVHRSNLSKLADRLGIKSLYTKSD